jgi:hypothetical protein
MIKESDKFILEEFKPNADLCEVCSKVKDTLHHLKTKEINDSFNIMLCGECLKDLKKILK